MCGRASQEEVDRYFERVFGWQMPEQFRPRRNIRPRGNEYCRSFVRRAGCNRKGQLVVPVGQHDGVGSQVSGIQYPCRFDGSKKDVASAIESGQTLHLSDRCLLRMADKGQRPAARKDHAIAGLLSRWHENGSPRWSFATFTVPPNDFMLPIHPQAMPVILDNIEAQKEWLVNGNRDLLVPYVGEMVADEMPDTLEKTLSRRKSSQQTKSIGRALIENNEEIKQGSLFG